jgi:hypothetical protein
VDKSKHDRLTELEKKMAIQKQRGSQLFWITYNPGSDFDYDGKDASEDIHWMIYEIKRLKEENDHYREFMNTYKKQMEEELGVPGNSDK